MSQPGKNVRLRRTQKLLREALIALIEERGFDALTIGELTERALVSRAAFYRNYQDKYDLVDQIFAEAMRALLAAVGDLGREHPPEIWVTFFEHIADYDNSGHHLDPCTSYVRVSVYTDNIRHSLETSYIRELS